MSADFAKARSKAVRLLLSSKLYGLKTDVPKLKYREKIIFGSFSSFCANSLVTLAELESFDNLRDGCTVMRKMADSTVYLVLYNDKIRSRKRLVFTLAHEVGHIILEHERDDAPQEAEANCFAAELVLPRILVWELQKRADFNIAAHEIAEIFGVSHAVSNNQIKSLRYDHDFFDDEKLLLKKLFGFLPDPTGPVIDC